VDSWSASAGQQSTYEASLLTIALASAADHAATIHAVAIIIRGVAESLKLEADGAPKHDSSPFTFTARPPPPRHPGNSAESPCGDPATWLVTGVTADSGRDGRHQRLAADAHRRCRWQDCESASGGQPTLDALVAIK